MLTLERNGPQSGGRESEIRSSRARGGYLWRLHGSPRIMDHQVPFKKGVPTIIYACQCDHGSSLIALKLCQRTVGNEGPQKTERCLLGFLTISPTSTRSTAFPVLVT
jgi:hypothetical protein